MEQPAIRYARSPDGVNIAYHEFGEGPPLVFVAPCPFSHIQRELEIPQVKQWWLKLARTHRIIRYDGRGNGLSDRNAADFSLDAQVRDLETVLDHLALKRVAVLGASIASPAAIAFAALHPARVSHLILWHAYAKGTDLYRTAFTATISLARLDWDLFIQTSAHAVIGWDQGGLAREYAEVFHAAVDQQTLLANQTLFLSQDVTRHLSRVQAPTLVLARRGMHVFGADLAKSLASRISNAQLLLLEGESPVPYLGDGETVLKVTREFLASDSPSPSQATDTPPTAALTTRETEVLSLLAGGHTGKEIAAALGVSLSTAQRHIANIYTKIGARGRVDAAAYALERGLVRPRDE
jgi:pimeloyl-ACP methyl ester carboxylesterase/DNA-binding CsgD family transcriptional regulator